MNTHQKTYKVLKAVIFNITKEDKNKFEEKLRSENGIYSRLANAFYFRPFVMSLLIHALAFVLIFTVWFAFKNFFSVNAQALSIFILVIYATPLLIIFVISKIRPRQDFSWDQYWGKVLNQYLEVHEYNSEDKWKIAKMKLERARLYYEREGKLTSLVMLACGSVLVSCLADPKFLTLLSGLNFKLFAYNPFGGIILLLMPFVYMYYFARYKLPAQWLCNTAVQLDLSSPD